MVAEEFDPFTLKDEPIEKIPDNEFLKDLLTIKNMDYEERNHFDEIFCKTLQNGRTRVRGFAIDPYTLQYEITAGYGTHRLAAMYLARRLWRTDNLRALQSKGQIDELGDLDFERFIIGDLVPDVTDEIRTPIFMPETDDSCDLEKLKQVSAYLLAEKICIPVDYCMNVIDKNYSPR